VHIIWSKRAETDLYLSIGHIAESSINNAKKILVDIIELSNSLGEFPYKYPREPYYHSESVRYAVIYSYKIVYKVCKDKIQILRLFHTKQNPRKI